jgi:3-methylcrotonyl-CoA carboxylase alpha subunit
VKPIERVLIANRGEIALRVMRTCRALGIDTVAVFSDADRDAPHVAAADCAVRIGPPASTESYLNIARIIEAARQTGADAIHPGYGFLAENAEFAEACASAGVIFIGPPPFAIRAMGSKRMAKTLMRDAGVPVIPWAGGEGQDDDQSTDGLVARGLELGFPLLVKASAGGGGKGMRIVAHEGELAASIEAARRESASAFGDGTLLLERYLERPRHVEIQILGDQHGHLVHLFERECSIQRRHQKIIEETPSTAVDDGLRRRMGQAAVDAGKAIGYFNAGTVEFLLAPDGEFYFLEVNTRLQVEHPITECITGMDLVREQIRVAQGEALGYQQADIRSEGAAIECRLYAEDPANHFMPASGRLLDWHIPPFEGLRVDSGVESGVEVSIHYDPMLAKVVTSGRDRAEAIRRMRRALRTLSVQGVRTNRDFLLATLAHPAFAAGEIDTHFIETHMGSHLASSPSAEAVREAALAATLVGNLERPRLLDSLTSGYRNNPYRPQWVDFTLEKDALQVTYTDRGDHYDMAVGDWSGRVEVVDWRPPELVIQLGDDRLQRFRVVRDGLRTFVHDLRCNLMLVEQPRFPERGADKQAGGYGAPMPGKVIAIEVGEGDEVEAGDVLVVMEAMKMEQSIIAERPGHVESVLVEVGEQVDADQILIVIA